MTIPLAQHLATTFSINELLAQGAVGDFSTDTWSARPGGVNHPTWILAHITQIRRGIARCLGGPDSRPAPGEAPVGFGDPCLPADRYPAPDALLREFSALGSEIAKRLDTADDALLASRFEPTFPDGRDRTVREALGFLLQHEALHIGQISLVRRLHGLPGVAEVVMRRMAESRPAPA